MKAKNKIKKARVLPGQQIAARFDDPWLSALWGRLPNPDAILRRRGEAGQQEIFDRLILDAHVIGELRAVRAGLLGFEWRIVPGGEGRKARRATDLAREVMARPPDGDATWNDVIWTMAVAAFRGFAVHNVVWGKFGGDILPARVVDRPQRRFVFDADDNALRALTRRDAVRGEEIPARAALLTRHMPSFDNPYGIAVFSACVWPFLFKHAGFKFFTQFTEKFGVPFMVGKYPAGWNAEQVDELVEALGKLAGNAVGAVEDGVEMLSLSGSAGSQAATPQERLIRACNQEISKALTSQTLATEIQGQGSRAASETHMQRERSVHVSDRAMVSATLNQLFRWVTDVNLGPDTPAPRHFFYEQDDAKNDWVTLVDKARHFLPLKKDEVYERLGLTPPAAGDEVLAPPAARPTPGADPRGKLHMTACPGCGEVHAFQAPRAAGGGRDDPLLDALEAALAGEELDAGAADGLAGELIRAAGDDPDAVSGRLAERYPDLDAAAFENLLARVFFVADMLGGGGGDA